MKRLLLLAGLSLVALRPACADNLLNADSNANPSGSVLSGSSIYSNTKTTVRDPLSDGRIPGNGSNSSPSDNDHYGESNSSMREKNATEDSNEATRGSTTVDGDIGMPNATYKDNQTSKGSIGVR